ncbi:MAG: ribonuclease HII [Oscillospiraceae bacterium]|jgi:ribonuclease HII|nr:ribonuclease HII [Oscillospiraceae bacterium]
MAESTRRTAGQKLAELARMDQEIWETGTVFAGIDEAGRGPLCGPVAAACVVMPPQPLLLGVDDSKKLSEARREILYERIMQTALFAGVGLAGAEEIDRLNILQATKLAMARAAQGAPCALFLVDGNQPVVLPGEVRCAVGGDARCYSIAAASIVAKVTRDRLLRRMDAEYPGYGFARHKGYGTAAHLAALRALGPTPQHRRSFLGHILGEETHAKTDQSPRRG